MNVTRDPRCPKHPGYAAIALYQFWPTGPMLWRCTACSRTLGVASIQSFLIDPPVTGHRRLTTEDAAWRLINIDWQYRGLM